MEVKTVIAIPARGSGPAKRQTGKRVINIDTDRLRQISDQLSELVEELDDIREDLGEIRADIEENYDMADYADGEEDTLYDKIENICDTVDGAYQELNEALDEIEGLL